MDLDRHARRVLALARQQRTPTSADRARIARRLALGVGVATATSTPAVAEASAALAGKTAATSAVLKWSLACIALATVAAGTYAALPPRTAPRRPAPTAPAPSPSPSPAPATPSPALAPSPSLASSPSPAPAPAPPPARLPRRARSASQLAQVELLHTAQAAWRGGDARSALSLLAEHRSRWPRSSLRIERDALRVLVLCDLGRQPEAARIARSLLARAPRSPLRASLEASCALAPAEP